MHLEPCSQQDATQMLVAFYTDPVAILGTNETPAGPEYVSDW